MSIFSNIKVVALVVVSFLPTVSLFASSPAWDSVPGVTVGWGSIDESYPQDEPASVSNKPLRLYAWKGEKVSAEAVISTPKTIKSLSLYVSDLKCGKNIIPSSSVRKFFVRYVITDAFGKHDVEALVADRLEEVVETPVEPRTSCPVWLEVSVPFGTPKGLYKGLVSVNYDGVVKKLPIEIVVADHVLPSPSEWTFHLDLWQNPYAFARYYDVPLWSEAHFEAMRQVMEMYAAAGGKVITASIIQHPWNCQTFDPFESMIAKVKKIDGTWNYDYEVFDKWVEFMMSCGIKGQIDCYTLVPWTYRFDYYDSATNSVKYVECEPQEAAYRELILPFLKDFSSHLKSQGWFDITCIAMDERPVEQMKAAYDILMEADPEYRIAGAANYSIESSEASMVYDMSVGYRYELISGTALSARRANGQKLTFYTCCDPERPNTFTFSPPAESAMLGWHAAAVGYDGYLRWALCSWPENPMTDSRFGHWAAGDTYLVYPGAPSIRYERMVEGIQAFEKVRILRENLPASELRDLEAVLKDCFSANFLDPSIPASLLVSRANAVIRTK